MLLNPYFSQPALPWAPTPVFQVTARMMGAVNNETYSLPLTSANGSGAVTWSIVSGSLPQGLHLNATTGVISGVPNAANGEYTATLCARDAAGNRAFRTMTFPVGTIISLLHMDGAGGATSISDTTGRAWTRGGNAVLNIDQKRFGTTSSFHDGSYDYWETPKNGSEMDFTGTSFTARVWVKPNYFGPGKYPGIFGSGGPTSGDTYDWMIYHDPNGTVALQAYNGNTPTNPGYAGRGSLTVGSWSFLTAGWNASDKKLRFSNNGLVTTSSTSNAFRHSPNSPLRVGVLGDNLDHSFNGWIDEVSLIKGAYLYPEDFSVPTAASDYPAAAAALTIRGSLPTGMSSLSYSSLTDLIVTGTPTSVSVVSGALPTGWTATLNGNYVQVAGPAIADGYYTFTLRVQDAALRTADLPLTLRMGAQRTATLPADALFSGWWDSSDTTAVDVVNTNQVNVIRDKSGNGHHLTASGANRHIYVPGGVNGRNSILGFNSSPATYSMGGTPIAMSGTSGWMIAVFRPRFGGNGTVFFGGSANDKFGLACAYNTGTSSARKLYNLTPTNGIDVGYAFETGETLLVAAKWGEGAGMYLGDAFGGVPGSTAWSIDRVLSYGLLDPVQTGWLLDGDFCELMVGNTNITFAKFEELRAYLAQKWGVRGRYDLALADVQGIKAWWDASDPGAALVSATPTMTLMYDKTGNAHHANVASISAPTQRKAQVGGKNTFYALQSTAVRLGMNASAVPATLAMSGKGTLLAVFRPTANGGDYGTLLFGGATTADYYGAMRRSDAMVYSYDTPTMALPATQFDGNTPSLVAMKWGEGAGMFANDRSNGAPGAGTRTVNGLINYNAAGWNLDGDFCEAMVIDQDITFAQFNLLRDRLRKKWALNLSGFEVLLHFSGTHGSTLGSGWLEDSSKTVTVTGTDVTLTTVRVSRGPAAATGFVNGSKISVPFAGASGVDWTVGCLFYWDGSLPAVSKALVSVENWELYLDGTTGGKVALWVSAGNVLTSAVVPAVNAWHLAVVEKVNSMVYLSVDGVVVANSSVAAFQTIPAGPLCVGNYPSVNSPFTGGTIEEVFVKTGTAIFGGQDFAVPVKSFAAVYPELPLWTPTNLASAPRAWYNDDSALTGTTPSIATIADLSGNALSASQVTVGNQPQRVAGVLNKRRVIRADGVDDYLKISQALGSVSMAIYIVLKCTGVNPGINSVISTRNPSNNGWSLDYDAGLQKLVSFFPGAPQGPVINGVALNKTHIVSVWKNGTSMRMGLNDVMTAYNDLLSYAVPAENVTYVAAEMFGDSLARFFGGDIAEIVALEYLPSQAEDERIHGYLAHRWSLMSNLQEGHPYKELPPVVGPVRDPYFSNVQTLLQPAGVDGSTVFTDLSKSARAIACVAPAAVGTKAGSSSAKVLIPGAGGRLEVNSTGIVIGANDDFTVEVRFWIDGTSNDYKYLLGWGLPSGTSAFSMRFGNNGFANMLHCGQDDAATGTIWQVPYSQTSAAGGWHTLTYSRRKGISRIFFDGTQQSVQHPFAVAGTAVNSWADTQVYTPNGAITIGGYSGFAAGLGSLNGAIDFVRLTVGVGRFTKNHYLLAPLPTA